jgi:ketosteroid isomerase-like protein
MNTGLSSRQRFEQIAHFFETLTPQSVSDLKDFYSASARFKDPFNDVKGVPAIEKIFEHMFVSLTQPHFVITGQVVDGDQAFLSWEFRFRFKRFDTQTDQVVLGTSHLVLDAQQRISVHRDYWDAAEELYEKLPWVGALMRWLKKKANS